MLDSVPLALRVPLLQARSHSEIIFLAKFFIHRFYVNMINFDLININTISNKNRLNNCSNISFKSSTHRTKDTFEKQSCIKTFDMSVYNPFDDVTCSSNVTVDLNKPQKIYLEGRKTLRWAPDLINSTKRKQNDIELDYNPDRTGVITDKKKNKPVKVVILKATRDDYTSYHFMSKDLKKEYGYLYLNLCLNPKDEANFQFFDSEIYLDYPEQKVTGPRVVVEYLQNNDDQRYGGIGKLADKLTVKHCLENNIKPVIVSVADCNSHVAHYLRGKRYLPLQPDSLGYKFFKQKYNCTDVNEILKNLIEKAEQTGEKVDVSLWGYTPMYMPEDLAQKYTDELKSEKK